MDSRPNHSDSPVTTFSSLDRRYRVNSLVDTRPLYLSTQRVEYRKSFFGYSIQHPGIEFDRITVFEQDTIVSVMLYRSSRSKLLPLEPNAVNHCTRSLNALVARSSFAAASTWQASSTAIAPYRWNVILPLGSSIVELSTIRTTIANFIVSGSNALLRIRSIDDRLV